MSIKHLFFILSLNLLLLSCSNINNIKSTESKAKSYSFQKAVLEKSKVSHFNQRFSLDEKLFAVHETLDEYHSTIRIWDTQTKKLKYSTQVGGKKGYHDLTYTNRIEFSPDSKMLFLAGNIGPVVAWDFTKQQQTHFICSTEEATVRGFSDDYQWILLHGWTEGERWCHTKSKKEIKDISRFSIKHGTEFNNKSALKYTLDMNCNTMSLYDKQSKKRIWQQKISPKILPKMDCSLTNYSPIFVAKGKHIYIEADNSVEIFDTLTGKHLSSYHFTKNSHYAKNHYRGILFDSELLVFERGRYDTSQAKQVILVSAKTAKVIKVFSGLSSLSAGISNPSGTRLVIYTPDKNIALVKITTK